MEEEEEGYFLSLLDKADRRVSNKQEGLGKCCCGGEVK